MAMNDNAKDWIADNLGVNGCMSEASRAFTYRDSINNTDIADNGGTAVMLNRLVDNIVPYITIGGTRYNYSDLRARNGGADVLFPGDVQWVVAHDSGSAAYCSGAGTGTGTGTGTGGASVTGQTVGPFTVHVGGGTQCPAGAPDVSLDASQAFAFFKADPHKYIGIGEIQVHNLSQDCFAYFIWEAKIYDGTNITTCATSQAIEHQEISRFLATAGESPISTTRLDATETDGVWGTFEVPASMEGEKTVCLSLWGNFDRDALIAELNAEGYY